MIRVGTWLTFDKRAHRMIQKEKVSCFLDDRMPPNWKIKI